MDYRDRFVRFLLDSGVLAFGDFTLKSGRKSPYMVNMGMINTGVSLSQLGCFYAHAIVEKIEQGTIPQETNILFGSAYKGIPLAAAASMAMSAEYGRIIGYTFNRKEAKDHGEGGIFVGKNPGPGDRILIVDDVMTAGTALRDTFDLLSALTPEAKVVGSIIAVDRKECGRDPRFSAVDETQKELGIPVFSIIDIDEIVALLKSGTLAAEVKDEQIDAIEAYLEKYRAPAV